ncbi:hypothetical protein HUT16_00090 [Kitasatospora sp. NA04385]|uniref:hypothetical protein n=1 Tax=Kitasatospora sp. NA04385 TaxID=2742135 RepID=UPI001590FC70|nr:hypothetical protein [Kitasatospora sp. NA04385]QKW17676.1 hypothetical protein HUT16_00090 [Kitasatospora sp. NA04385]
MISSAALAVGAIAVTTSPAQAASGTGTPNLGCWNTVVLDHGGGYVYAYGTFTCDSARTWKLIPNVVLSGNNGQYGFVDNSAVCSGSPFNGISYCRTPTVRLKEIPGVTYRASNSGSVEDQEFWPVETVAHAQMTGEEAPWKAGDFPVSGNWDQGMADNVGIWRPSTGEFHLRNDNGSLNKISWGQYGDIPVSGNWDGGNGTPNSNVGIWRPSTGQFHLRMDNGSNTVIDWGQDGDIPVSGNWDGGNGTPNSNVGIWRPSTGQFHLRMDNGSDTVIDWGQLGDIPVSGNWDGGPADNIGVYRPSEGVFHLRMDNGGLVKVSWGGSTDIPVSGNWDGGNGTANGNVGVWHPATAEFRIRTDEGNLIRIAWGNPR